LDSNQLTTPDTSHLIEVKVHYTLIAD